MPNWKPLNCTGGDVDPAADSSKADRCVIDIVSGAGTVSLGPLGFQHQCTAHRSIPANNGGLQLIVSENRELNHIREKCAEWTGVTPDDIPFHFDTNRRMEFTLPPGADKADIQSRVNAISNKAQVK